MFDFDKLEVGSKLRVGTTEELVEQFPPELGDTYTYDEIYAILSYLGYDSLDQESTFTVLAIDKEADTLTLDQSPNLDDYNEDPFVLTNASDEHGDPGWQPVLFDVT